MALRKFLYQDPTDLYHVEQATTDELSMGKITLLGVSGVAIDASGQLISNVAAPVSDQDAATKAYVDAAAYSIDWKNSVHLATTAALPSYTAAGSGVGKTLTATANGALSVDSVAVVAGNRILVKDQATSHVDHGLYVVTAAGSVGTPFILTRTIDADQNAEVTSGLSVFVEAGTVNTDSGWVLITQDPIVVDTTALQFTQFTGLGQVTAGAGLTKTGNTLDVGDGAGILVTANAIEVELATNPALEFDVVGAAGKLEWKPDTSRGLAKDASGGYVAISATPGLEFAAGLLQVLVDPNGGIDRVSAGIKVKMDNTPTTLSESSAGLKVVGLPSLFLVNGTAVGSTVTAPNLDTLTDGSNADALHVHSMGDTSRVSETWTANGALTKGQGVYISAANSVSTGDCSTVSKSYILGVADANIPNTSAGLIVRSGVVTAVLSGATAGARYFLSASGTPVLAGALPSSARTIQLGFAKNSTDLDVFIFDYGKKA